MSSSNKIIIAFNNRRYKSIPERLINIKKKYALIEYVDAQALEYKKIKEINPDWIFFPHWSEIIPKEIYENYKCIIFHMTDLPYGRGGSPLQNLIIRGHKDTKISAIKCVSQIDAGEIYLQRFLSLEGTAEEILKRAADIMSEMIEIIINTNPVPVPQNGTITTFQRRKPHESDISALDSIEKIHDYIRMLDADGYPHAFLEMNKMRLEFTNSSIVDGTIEAKVKISARK